MKRTAEVVIIGGGCLGTSTAYHLAKLGLTNLVLVERDHMLGTGSTGRNAGGVRHQFSSEANIRLSIESISLLERFQEEVGYEIDFHQDGYLFLLSTQDAKRAFHSNVQLQRGLGVEVSELSPEEAAKLAPGLSVEGVIGATFCARDGIADPNGVTMGFAKAAQSAGVEINRDTEVTGIKIEAGKVSAVETNHGEISTRTVVNAAGPYARNIGFLAGLDIPVLPYRRHIFITKPLAPPDAPSSRIMVIDFETTFYFHREGAGILFGMSDPDEASTFDISVNWEFLERLIPIASRRLPALGDSAIAHSWAGLYEVTPDATPIIGRAPELEGFYMINGFSGHGFQHSPAAGRLLADLIVKSETPDFDLRPFAYERFSTGAIEPEKAVV